jgi:hypothetical protein
MSAQQKEQASNAMTLGGYKPAADLERSKRETSESEIPAGSNVLWCFTTHQERQGTLTTA